MKFPEHKASLHLEHNEHKAMYQTVAVYLEENDWFKDDEWVSPEQKQKALDTNELWRLQWYPDTPIGFYTLMAADLDVLLEAACAVE